MCAAGHEYGGNPCRSVKCYDCRKVKGKGNEVRLRRWLKKCTQCKVLVCRECIDEGIEMAAECGSMIPDGLCFDCADSGDYILSGDY